MRSVYRFVSGFIAFGVVGWASAADPPTLDQRRATLQAAVEARFAAGEKAPSHESDPGYPIMQCEGINPVPTVLAPDNYQGLAGEIDAMLTIMAGSSRIICGNSTEGARIVAYREWYCGEKRTACALSSWVDGRPTFSQTPLTSIELDLSAKAPDGGTVSMMKATLSPLR